MTAVVRATGLPDPFTAAVVLGGITGAMALVLPFLSAVTGALAALAGAAWATRGPLRPPRGAARWLAAGSAAGVLVGAAGFLFRPGPYAPFSPAGLALSVGGLWFAERRGAFDRRCREP